MNLLSSDERILGNCSWKTAQNVAEGTGTKQEKNTAS